MALPLTGPPPPSVPPCFRDRHQLSLALRTLLEHVGLGHLWGSEGPRTPAIDAFLQRSQLEVAAEAPVLRLVAPVLRLVMGLWRGRAVFAVFEGLHLMGGRLHGTVMAFLAALAEAIAAAAQAAGAPVLGVMLAGSRSPQEGRA